MATEMRPSRVHVAWAHGIDDSKRAGTVNTHCWKVARVILCHPIGAPSGRTCTRVLNINININIDLLISYKVHQSLSKGTHLTAFALIEYGR